MQKSDVNYNMLYSSTRKTYRMKLKNIQGKKESLKVTSSIKGIERHQRYNNKMRVEYNIG
jgi:hypothetical protein